MISSLRHLIQSKKQGELIQWGSSIKQCSTIIHMIKLLNTFDPESQIPIKSFPDNVNWAYINGVVGKRCFELMKEPENIDDSFSWFALRHGAVAITPGSTYWHNKLCDDNSLRLVHTINATHLTRYFCGTMSDILHMLQRSEFLIDTFIVDSDSEGKDLWFFAFECEKNSIKFC